MNQLDDAMQNIGKQFGRLTVMEAWRDSTSKVFVDCYCSCGEDSTVKRWDHVKSGMTTSCGCFAKEMAAERSRTHGDSGTRLFSTWVHMRQRCNNQTDRAYASYGGRGIRVCREWDDSYDAFREWAMSHGYAVNLTIERVDNDGDYTPENCRWISHLEQTQNRRTSVKVTAFGETKCIGAWARDARCSVRYQSLYDRLERGMPAELAISQPSMRPHDWRLGKIAGA